MSFCVHQVLFRRQMISFTSAFLSASKLCLVSLACSTQGILNVLHKHRTPPWQSLRLSVGHKLAFIAGMAKTWPVSCGWCIPTEWAWGCLWGFCKPSSHRSSREHAFPFQCQCFAHLLQGRPGLCRDPPWGWEHCVGKSDYSLARQSIVLNCTHRPLVSILTHSLSREGCSSFTIYFCALNLQHNTFLTAQVSSFIAWFMQLKPEHWSQNGAQQAESLLAESALVGAWEMVSKICQVQFLVGLSHMSSAQTFAENKDLQRIGSATALSCLLWLNLSMKLQKELLGFCKDCKMNKWLDCKLNEWRLRGLFSWSWSAQINWEILMIEWRLCPPVPDLSDVICDTKDNASFANIVCTDWMFLFVPKRLLFVENERFWNECLYVSVSACKEFAYNNCNWDSLQVQSFSKSYTLFTKVRKHLQSSSTSVTNKVIPVHLRSYRSHLNLWPKVLGSCSSITLVRQSNCGSAKFTIALSGR